jgi:hypothetical protein
MDLHVAQLEDSKTRIVLWVSSARGIGTLGITEVQDAENTTTDTSPNASNTLPEADQAPFTSTRLLGRKLQNGSILPLPGALGLDSFQAGAVGEESIRGRFSDRVERPQDIYQVSRARRSFCSRCLCSSHIGCVSRWRPPRRYLGQPRSRLTADQFAEKRARGPTAEDPFSTRWTGRRLPGPRPTSETRYRQHPSSLRGLLA